MFWMICIVKLLVSLNTKYNVLVTFRSLNPKAKFGCGSRLAASYVGHDLIRRRLPKEFSLVALGAEHDRKAAKGLKV